MDERGIKQAIWELCERLVWFNAAPQHDGRSVDHGQLGLTVTHFKKLGINNSECIILRHDAYAAVLIRHWPDWEITADRLAHRMGRTQYYVTGNYQRIAEAVTWLRMSSLT